MGEEIAFENGLISDFQGLVTLILDRVTLHTVMHHSSTSCGQTDVRTGGRTLETHFIKSTRRSQPYKHKKLKPGLIASYDLRPANGTDLF